MKPINGDSSDGIEAYTVDELLRHYRTGYLIQPKITFMYATESAGPDNRWQLHEINPSDNEVVWAMQFVSWNKMPYGLQRIDACRLPDNRLLLMEIEDQMPYLSLDILTDGTKEKFINFLVESLQIQR